MKDIVFEYSIIAVYSVIKMSKSCIDILCCADAPWFDIVDISFHFAPFEVFKGLFEKIFFYDKV